MKCGTNYRVSAVRNVEPSRPCKRCGHAAHRRNECMDCPYGQGCTVQIVDFPTRLAIHLLLWFALALLFGSATHRLQTSIACAIVVGLLLLRVIWWKWNDPVARAFRALRDETRNGDASDESDL